MVVPILFPDEMVGGFSPLPAGGMRNEPMTPRDRRQPRAKVPCPVCRSRVSKVIDCGPSPRAIRDQLEWTGKGYWRRRKCEECGATFDTAEEISSPIQKSA
jgi:hypothetical protein